MITRTLTTDTRTAVTSLGKMKPNLKSACFVFVLASFASGCGSTGDQLTTPILLPNTLKVPQLEILQSGGQTLKQARSSIILLIGQCMRKRGWSKFVTYESLWPGGVGQAGAPIMGYGISFKSVAAVQPLDDPNDDFVMDLEPVQKQSYLEDLFGISDLKNSCMKQSEMIVYKDSAIYSVKTRRLAEEVSKKTALDPRVSSAWVKWTECMSNNGFSGLSRRKNAESFVQAAFDDLASKPVKDQELTNFQEFELKVKEADKGCYRGTVETVTRKVEDAYASQAIEILNR
jgi:hypothetical protein